MKTYLISWCKFWYPAALALLACALTPLAGCEQAGQNDKVEQNQEKKQDQESEKIIDVNVPGVEVEVEKSEDGGSVDVKVPPTE